MEPKVGMVVRKKFPGVAFADCVGVVTEAEGDVRFSVVWFHLDRDEPRLLCDYFTEHFALVFRVFDDDEARMFLLAYPQLCVTSAK